MCSYSLCTVGASGGANACARRRISERVPPGCVGTLGLGTRSSPPRRRRALVVVRRRPRPLFVFPRLLSTRAFAPSEDVVERPRRGVLDSVLVLLRTRRGGVRVYGGQEARARRDDATGASRRDDERSRSRTHRDGRAPEPVDVAAHAREEVRADVARGLVVLAAGPRRARALVFAHARGRLCFHQRAAALPKKN